MKKNIYFSLDKLKLPIQAINSEFCGAYVCFAVVELFKSKTKSVASLFKQYKPGTRSLNDKRISSYVNTKWPNQLCSVKSKSNINQLKIPLFMRKNGNYVKKTQFCPKLTYGDTKCLKLCKCAKNLCCD